jgi:hypothetical protein
MFIQTESTPNPATLKFLPGKEGPGPLVAAVVGKAAAFPIPVTVVPQNLSDEEILSLA